MAVGLLLRPLALTSATPIPPKRALTEPVDVGVVAPWSCSVLRIHVLSPHFEVVSMSIGGRPEPLALVPSTEAPRTTVARSYDIHVPAHIKIGEVLRVLVTNEGQRPGYFEANLLCEIAGPAARPRMGNGSARASDPRPTLRLSASESLVPGPPMRSVAGLSLSLINALESGDDERVASVASDLLTVLRVEDHVDTRAVLRALIRFSSRSLAP